MDNLLAIRLRELELKKLRERRGLIEKGLQELQYEISKLEDEIEALEGKH